MIAEVYAPVFEALGLPKQALALCRGELAVPMATYSSPYVGYGFPPALLPLCSNSSGPDQLGYWHHHFCNRAPSVVRLYVEGGYRATESSRTFEQFAALFVLEKIVADDALSDEARSFAAVLGVSEKLTITLDSISNKTGDRPSGVLAIPLFQSNPPLESCLDAGVQYSGDFPDPRVKGNNSPLFCGLEIEEGVIISPTAQSPWLGKGDPQLFIFEGCMSRRDWAGAWMSLNSPGWSFHEASDALDDLSRSAKDSTLSLVAEAWTTCAREMHGNY